MRSGRVLIIEDEEEVSRQLSLWLQLRGYEVETAGNGEIGLKQMDLFAPDLLLLDLQMPVLDGWEFLERFRKRRDWLKIPVIVISQVEEYQRRPPLEAIAFLPKPLDLERVTETVECIVPWCMIGNDRKSLTSSPVNRANSTP